VTRAPEFSEQNIFEMLNGDVAWFKKKNRRILLELIAILNYLTHNNQQDVELIEKINFFKSQNIGFLELIFLSPEGRQWIYFTYAEIKANNNEALMLDGYAKWLGITRRELRQYLIQKLDEFIFYLVILARKTPKYKVAIRVKSNAVFRLNHKLWRLENGIQIELSSTVNVSCVEGLDNFRVNISSNGLEFIADLSKLHGSTKYPFYIDLYSEASRCNFPGREELTRVSERATEVLLEQTHVIEKAMDYIGRVDPSINQYFQEFPNYFVPLIGPEGALPSSSNSSVDAMFWYSTTNQPLLMAEMIIHEYSHQRLFRLQDTDPLLNPKIHGSGWDRCEIYSPWRDDPRPINGVLHGFIVFTEAAKFWMELINQVELQHEEIDISQRRMTMLALQLNHAQKSLASITYTTLGLSILKAYTQVLEGSILPYIQKHKLGNLKPFFMEYHDQEQPYGLSIAEVVEQHKYQWIVRNGGRK